MAGTTTTTDGRRELVREFGAVASAYGMLGSPPVASRMDGARTEEELDAFVLKALELELTQGALREDLEEKSRRVGDLWRYYASRREAFGRNARLTSCATVRDAFESVLRRMSARYSRARGEDNGEGKKWAPPSTFERRTIKYWVHPRDVVPLQLEIMKRLPILEFDEGSDGSDASEKNARDMSLITSVYLDNSSFDAYHTRLLREQGASLVRCRWYGSLTPDETVFVERKTHHESWSGQSSVKERCKISREDLIALVDGKEKDESLQNALRKHSLAREVFEREIKFKKASPVLMTRYRRTAFQHSDNNHIRISLDSGLRWCKVSGSCDDVISSPPADELATDFMHAILEVKLASGKEGAPDWIEEVVHSFDIVEVYKFSKFLHGCAILYPADSLHRLPHWFDPSLKLEAPNPTSKSSSPEPQYMDAMPLNGFHASDDAMDFERTESSGSFTELLRAAVATLKFRKIERKSSPMNGGGETDNDIEAASMSARRRYVPVKVEPKTFFANERTLLQWLSMSILLLFLGLGLLSIESSAASTSAVPFGDAPGSQSSGSAVGNPFAGAICGIVLTPISILFMLYALWTYIVRARRIARREASTRYDDVVGPVALVAILVVVSVVCLILAATSIEWDRVRYAARG
jgi:uncharacterized membrane protein YidH (DUF202 family)